MVRSLRRGASVLALTWSASANAQSIDGAVRLSLDATVLSYESFSLESKDAAVENIDATESSAGLFASSMGIGVGYAPTPSLVLGAKVHQGTTTRTLDNDTLGTYKTSGLGLSPYVELVLSPESTFQPYLGANLSIRSYETSNGDATISSGSTFALGLGVGAHVFATESFSIDPAFSAFRVNGSEKVGDLEFDRGGWAFLASFAFSGWLGASQTSAHRPAIDTDHRVDPVESSATARGGGSVGPAPSIAATPTRRDGLVSITIRLNGGTVTFGGRPESAPRQLAFRVRVSTSGKRFKECQSLSVMADGEQYKAANLKYSERLGGNRVTEDVQGTLSLAAVAALGEADGSALVQLCDLELSVGMPERGKMYDFFETFKGLEPGAWSPPSGVRLQRGHFSLDFRIKDHSLRYGVRPRRGVNDVELRVTGAADSCRELRVLVDDRVHSEHELSPPGASGPSRSGGQVSKIPLSAIEAQSQASSAAIQLCETTLPLSARKREQLGGLVKASRSYGAKVGDQESETGSP